MRFLLLFVFLSIALPQLRAQVITQPARFETEVKGSDEYYGVISLRENGIALLRDLEKYTQGNTRWELIILDQNLEMRGKAEISLKNRLGLIGYEVTTDRLYLLFHVIDNHRGDLELLELDFNAKELNRFTIQPELEIILTHFTVVNGNALLGGKVSTEPAVLHFNSKSKTLKVLKGFFQPDTELLDLRVNQNNTFNTLVVDINSRRERKLAFKTFDQDGEVLLESNLPVEEPYYPYKAKTTALYREDLAVLGSWSTRAGKSQYGLFFSSIDPFSPKKPIFIPFGKLTHYTDYLSEKRANRIKEEAANLKPSEVPNFSNSIALNGVEETAFGFLVHFESFTAPTSSINNFNSPANPYNPYFRSFNTRYQMVMGSPTYYKVEDYRYQQASVVAIAPNGKCLWDYSIKFDEVKSGSLEQLSDFIFTDNRLYLTYKKDLNLFVRSVEVSSGIVSDFKEPVKPKYSDDVIRYEKEMEGGIRYWFGKNFYCFGYQTVRNETLPDKSRQVFYVNKVTVP